MHISGIVCMHQVCQHDWVTNNGELLPLVRCEDLSASGSLTPLAEGLSKAEEKNALTAWGQQVKAAMPCVEEKVFKKGEVLIR